jgi:hypothetical protein
LTLFLSRPSFFLVLLFFALGSADKIFDITNLRHYIYSTLHIFDIIDEVKEIDAAAGFP